MFLKFVHVSCNRLLVYRANASIGNFLVKLPLLLIGIPFKVSRVDGRDRFDLLKFAMGILALPVVVGWFLAKLAGNPKTLLP